MKKLISALILAGIGLALSAQPKQLTVKEFLKLSDKDTTSYLVKGVVSKIRSSSSGSFYLTDKTGTMLIYGIQDPADPTRSFKQLDIVKGDTLSVAGRFTLYAGQTKEMKDGRLVAKADGPEHSLSFYDRLDSKPSFKGKEGKEAVEAFREWVQANLVNPGGATGKVKVSFAVGRNGKVQEVQVLKGSGKPALDAEAVRVVNSSPKWKPAKADGAPLRLQFDIDVVFE